MFYQLEHLGISEYFRKDFSENYSCPVHLHQSFEMNIVLSGEMEITVDKNVYTVKKNEAVMIFPHQLHSVKSKTSSHMVCIFSPDIVKAYAVKVSALIPKNGLFSPSSEIVSSLKKLSNDSSVLRKKGLLYCLCDEFDANASYMQRDAQDRNLLCTIFEFVDNNCHKNCSLEELSSSTAFSYSYLSRYFKRTVGISFNSYVNRCRISKACYNLTNTDTTVLECSVDCGYNNLRSFNRNFKIVTGMTPVEYRGNLK